MSPNKINNINNLHSFSKLEGMKVLVTGGAGFIGSNIVKKLIAEGSSVFVLDNLFSGKLENLPQSPLLEFIEGSVTDYNIFLKLAKEVDIIIHEAARNIIISIENPKEDYEVNVGGTLNVLLAAREAEVNRVVYASSVSIYGNSRYLPINEDDGYNLLSPYAVSKFAGENYCAAFYESYNLPTAIVRYSNIYGKNQNPENPYCGVIGKFFAKVLANLPPEIHGDGEQTRDFTYIDDAVKATLLAAVSEKAIGKVYNVGSGRETNINYLAKYIIEICGKNLIPIHIDRRDIDNVRRRVMNIERIRKELRWEPETNLENGLKKTKVWIEKNLTLRKNSEK